VENSSQRSERFSDPQQVALVDFMDDFEKRFWPIYKRAGIDKGAALSHYTHTYYLARADSFLAEIAYLTGRSYRGTEIKQEQTEKPPE